MFISHSIPPCHSTHPPQHPHLIYFYACFLSPRCCPGLCTIYQSWSDHSFVTFPLQFHWHPPVTQHSTASLPVSPCCTHSLYNFCCHASCILHALSEILKIILNYAETRIPVGRLEINPIERLARIGCSNHNFSMKETSRVPTLLDVDVDSDDGEEDAGRQS